MKREIDSNFLHFITGNLHQQCGELGACSYAVGDCVCGHCTFCLVSAGQEFAPSFLPWALKTSLDFGLQRGTNSWRAGQSRSQGRALLL